MGWRLVANPVGEGFLARRYLLPGIDIKYSHLIYQWEALNNIQYLLVAYLGINYQGYISDRGWKAEYWLEHLMTDGKGQKGSHIDFK